jgi:site-specific recombinase XerD
MQKISYNIRFFEHVKKNGKSRIYLQLTIDRVARRIPLELEYYSALFDKQKEHFKYNGVNDEESRDLNLIINQEKARANEIVRYYRLSGKKLTHNLFKSEFLNYASRDSFFNWAESKILEDYRSENIAEQTFKNKKNRLKHFNEFAGDKLTFSQIDYNLIVSFETYLRKKLKLKYNTAVCVLVTIKSLLSDATDAGINLDNPFAKFKIGNYKESERLPLEIEEVRKLKDKLNSGELTEFENEVLRKFLFSCYTGLRISDSNQLDYKHIYDNTIRIDTVKGLNFGKTAIIPLPKYALELLENKTRGKVFENMTDQACNRALKQIAIKAGINKNLTFHVSRDTFGTLFIELGGDVATLKDLMAHTKVETTMIYVKISENRKQKLMSNFDSL